MKNYTTYKIDSRFNNKFDVTSFVVLYFFVLKSFLIETLQIQFYNFKRNQQKEQTDTINHLENGQDEEGIKDLLTFSVQSINASATSFDTFLFLRNFKIYI